MQHIDREQGRDGERENRHHRAGLPGSHRSKKFSDRNRQRRRSGAFSHCHPRPRPSLVPTFAPCCLAAGVLHYLPIGVNPSAMASILSRTLTTAAAVAILSAGLFDRGPVNAASVSADNWVTRPNTVVRVLLMKANQPADAVMLLPGGHGNINLDSQGHIGWGEDDFVIRTRWHYLRSWHCHDRSGRRFRPQAAGVARRISNIGAARRRSARSLRTTARHGAKSLDRRLRHRRYIGSQCDCPRQSRSRLPAWF